MLGSEQGVHIMFSICILGSEQNVHIMSLFQVLGSEQGVHIMQVADPLFLLISLPTIPIMLILCNMVRWEDYVLRLWRKHSLKIPFSTSDGK